MVVASAAVGYVMLLAYKSPRPNSISSSSWCCLWCFCCQRHRQRFHLPHRGRDFDRQQAGPVLGWTSAIGAYGSFIAPVVIGQQIKAGTPEIAMYGFAVFTPSASF